jgi:hypothetical protein
LSLIDPRSKEKLMAGLIAKLLALVAVVLMPLCMSAAPGATPHHGMSASMPSHCPEQPAGSHGKAGIAECTMICSATLPAADMCRDAPMLTIAGLLPEQLLALSLRGIHPDTATPPPRHS